MIPLINISSKSKNGEKWRFLHFVYNLSTTLNKKALITSKKEELLNVTLHNFSTTFEKLDSMNIIISRSFVV